MGPRVCLALLVTALLGPRPGQAKDAATTELARKHFELGSAFYRTSNYRKAVEHFQKSYELSPRPALLFNIARAFEPVDVQQAVVFYRRYLAEAGSEAENRSLVQARLDNLQQQATASGGNEGAPPGSPSAEKSGGGRGADEDAASGPKTWRTTAGWILLAGGGAALTTGIIMGALASSKASEYEEAKLDQPYRVLSELEDSGQTLETWQIAGLVVGGTVIAAGAGLLLWERMAERPGASAARRRLIAAPCTGHHHLGLCAAGQF